MFWQSIWSVAYRGPAQILTRYRYRPLGHSCQHNVVSRSHYFSYLGIICGVWPPHPPRPHSVTEPSPSFFFWLTRTSLLAFNLNRNKGNTSRNTIQYEKAAICGVVAFVWLPQRLYGFINFKPQRFAKGLTFDPVFHWQNQGMFSEKGDKTKTSSTANDS